MKELSEYTAEVMRRADEKKRARKRAAIRTVSLCVPLALAASAALVLLPRSKPGTDIEAAVPTHAVPDGAAPESAADITVFVEPMSADDQFIESQEDAENAGHLFCSVGKCGNSRAFVLLHAVVQDLERSVYR